MAFPHKHQKNLKTHSSCNDGSFDNNIHLGWGQEHTSLNVEHSQGVSHINPDSKASRRTEDFTVYQGWSYGELIAHWKENVLRASQIILLKAVLTYCSKPSHSCQRLFFFKLGFVCSNTFKLLSPTSIAQKILWWLDRVSEGIFKEMP